MNINIKKLREKAGLSQTELTHKLGLKSNSTVCMWESGDRCPRTELLPQLAKILNCTIDDLYSE